jgi:hypothetical protein
MFSNLSSSSISLATVTPSLVMRAERLVEHDVAALGAERYAHRIGEHFDAAQHLVAGVGGKSHFLRSHFPSLLLFLDFCRSPRGR